MPETSDRAETTRGNCGLSAAIIRPKTKPQSLAVSPHPLRSCLPSPSQRYQQVPEEAVAVSVGLQSTLSAALRTGEEDAFLPKQQVRAVANPSDRWK